MAPRRGERVPTANTKKGHKVRSTDISKQGTDKLSKIDVAQNIRKVIAVQKTLQRPSKTSSTQNRSQRLYMRLVGNRKVRATGKIPSCQLSASFMNTMMSWDDHTAVWLENCVRVRIS